MQRFLLEARTWLGALRPDRCFVAASEPSTQTPAPPGSQLLRLEPVTGTSLPALPPSGSEERGVTGRAEPDSRGPSHVCHASPPTPLAGLWAPLALVSSTKMQRPFPARQLRTAEGGDSMRPGDPAFMARGGHYVNVGFSSHLLTAKSPALVSSRRSPWQLRKSSRTTGRQQLAKRMQLAYLSHKTCIRIMKSHCLHVKIQLLF